ncbi:hypothetical protein [Streptomyces werraensis]|uniref:hypothetical protein n=1 Tax=Streptomyces werraensis TaxID=68284 RepID=UPI0037005D02
MSDIRTCGIVVPTDWVPLPLEPFDEVRGWAKTTAVELCERGRAAGHDLDRRTLRRDLRARAEDSRSRDPFYAFALYPDGFDSAVALLEADLLWPDETVPRITLNWLTERFSADDFGGPKVTRTELPAGPAVRIRQNLAMSGFSAVDAGLLLETLTYGVLPTGSKAAVMLLGSWSVPGLTEEMEEAVDSVAATLTVQF